MSNNIDCKWKIEIMSHCKTIYRYILSPRCLWSFAPLKEKQKCIAERHLYKKVGEEACKRPTMGLWNKKICRHELHHRDTQFTIYTHNLHEYQWLDVISRHVLFFQFYPGQKSRRKNTDFHHQRTRKKVKFDCRDDHWFLPKCIINIMNAYIALAVWDIDPSYINFTGESTFHCYRKDAQKSQLIFTLTVYFPTTIKGQHVSKMTESVKSH